MIPRRTGVRFPPAPRVLRIRPEHCWSCPVPARRSCVSSPRCARTHTDSSSAPVGARAHDASHTPPCVASCHHANDRCSLPQLAGRYDGSPMLVAWCPRSRTRLATRSSDTMGMRDDDSMVRTFARTICTCAAPVDAAGEPACKLLAPTGFTVTGQGADGVASAPTPLNRLTAITPEMPKCRSIRATAEVQSGLPTLSPSA
jgi:hypothetical protein